MSTIINKKNNLGKNGMRMNAEVDQDIINALGQSQQCGSTWAGLGWAWLGWAGLGWAGLGWAGTICLGNTRHHNNSVNIA